MKYARITLPLCLLLLASATVIPGFSLNRQSLGADVAWVAAPSDGSQDANPQVEPYVGYDYDDMEEFGDWEENDEAADTEANWRAACLAQHVLDYLNDPIRATIFSIDEEGTDDATVNFHDSYGEEDYRLIHDDVTQGTAGEFDEGEFLDYESWCFGYPHGEDVNLEDDAWWPNVSTLWTAQTPSLNLFAWLPDELLNGPDQKMLCRLQDLSDEPADVRHDWFRDRVEVLGPQAVEMSRRLNAYQEDAFVELADNPSGAAVFLAIHRLVEQGELNAETAADVLEQSLESIPETWTEGVNEVLGQDQEESPQETIELQATENSASSSFWGEEDAVLRKLQHVAGVVARLMNRMEGMK